MKVRERLGVTFAKQDEWDFFGLDAIIVEVIMVNLECIVDVVVIFDRNVKGCVVIIHRQLNVTVGRSRNVVKVSIKTAGTHGEALWNARENIFKRRNTVFDFDSERPLLELRVDTSAIV